MFVDSASALTPLFSNNSHVLGQKILITRLNEDGQWILLRHFEVFAGNLAAGDNEFFTPGAMILTQHVTFAADQLCLAAVFAKTWSYS